VAPSARPFRDRITLYLGGKEIQVLYLGRAHTRGDSIIYVPQDRIVYLSEIFSAGQFLFMNDGYGLDWLKTVETAAGFRGRGAGRTRSDCQYDSTASSSLSLFALP